MSKFIFLDPNDIAEEHYHRASEILGTYLNRDDAQVEDLVMMIAEALQTLDDRPIEGGQLEAEEEGPDVEVTLSNIK